MAGGKHHVEPMIDLMAADCDMDTVVVRRKNFPAPSEFSFTTATGLSYDSGDYQASLDKTLEHTDYHRFQDEQTSRRQEYRGSPRRQRH